MAATFQRNAERFFRALDTKIEPPVKNHLKQVYTTVAYATLTAGATSYTHLYVPLGGILTSLAAFAFAMMLHSTHDTGKNTNRRLAYLLAFAAMTGFSMGPIVQMALFLNPTIIPVALISTSLVFASFSLSAIFSDHRKYLYLGGTILSLTSVMMFMSIANLFIGSYFMFQAQLYLGLVLFSCFIMYDTADIIERKRRGDNDHIKHALHLFIDFVDLLRTVIILLMQKEQNRRRSDRK